MGTSAELKISNSIFNMKTCTLILAFAVAAAQASYWGQGNCGFFEYECKGNWNDDHTQQDPNYCIPNKIPSEKIEGYQCDNKCPLKPACDEYTYAPHIPCYKGEAIDYYGCPEHEYCFQGKFCPVYCNWNTEYACPGQWKIEDGKKVEQLTPDFCQPTKIEIAGIGECENYCDLQTICPEGKKTCSDMIDPWQKNPDGSLKGCKFMPWCMPADEECPEIFEF